MKKNIIYLCFISFLLAGCIEPYKGKMDSIDSILVVEGIITSGTTHITLSKSFRLDEGGAWASSITEYVVNDAEVYVECDDGTRTGSAYSTSGGVYRIETGELNIDAKYRLTIYMNDEVYHSGYIAPAISPPVNISFKTDQDNIYVCVTTYGYKGQPGYYLWSYDEDWEARIFTGGRCWQNDSSKILILGNTEKLIENTIREQIIKSFTRTDSRTSVLYHVKVTQNTIHKEAYDYFYNVQKNSSWNPDVIFGHIPSEIMGNIKCATNPDIPVIGYVDVSTTSTDEQYLDNTYYDPSIEFERRRICSLYREGENAPEFCHECGW